MDREDTGRLSCSLGPSTYVTLLFLLLLFMMIGAFLYHFLTAMILSWPAGNRAHLGCSDAVHHDDNHRLTSYHYDHMNTTFNYSRGTGSNDNNDFFSGLLTNNSETHVFS